ncbi:SDR family NAD(P)-dependent oxidoreductase [Xanthobacteraceae bacterium A53D]
MDLGLSGKVALVTGAARGIGRAEAQALAAEGARIVVNDIDADAARHCVEELRQAGFEAASAPGDVSVEPGAADVVAAALSAFGSLDILVNNAGAGGRHLGRPVAEMEAEDFDIIVSTHLRSTFLCSKHAVAAMCRGGFGRIVNTSSMNVTGGGRPGVANYSAAKAGVLGFTRTFAKEVGGAGITVNAIAPGYVATDFIATFSPEKRAVITGQNPIGRFCQPEEVGALVAFLCSTQAAFINGALICMDGGKRDFHWGDA